MKAPRIVRHFWQPLVFVVLALFTLSPNAFGQERAQDLFQQALRMERVSGNLEGAIRLYQGVVETGDRPLGARALIRIAESYEKMGRQGAQDAYARVIQDFGDQIEQVILARERLMAMEPSPAGPGEVRITTRQLWAGLDAGVEAPTPDGEYLVWVDWQGSMDLAVREIATGENRVLTRQASLVPPVAYTYNGRVSPDGGTVAFGLNDGAGAGGLHVIGMNGTDSRELYRETGCWLYPQAWMSDGNSLVARRDCWSTAYPEGIFETLLVSVSDGSLQVLNNLLDVRQGQSASLSPDDRHLAYNYVVEEESGNADIWILALDGSGDGPLIQHPADDQLLGWVPGTNQLLFFSDRDGTRDLWTAAVEGGLMSGSPRMVRRNVGQIQPAGFSRDGSLFYSVSTRWFSTSIAPFDASSGIADEGSATPLLGSNHSAAWSPDGERLAFLTEPGNPTSKDAELHIRHLATGRERELALQISSRRISGWSPDGSMVLVAGWDESLETEEYRGGLYRVNVEEAEATLVLNYPSDVQWPQGVGAVWSADGEAIIYSVVNPETRDGRLVWRDLGSGEEREVLRDSVLRGTRVLSLSPTGNLLAFGVEKSESEGPPEESRRVYLMTVDIESGSTRRLAELDASTDIASVQWTPDGQYVLFGESRQGDEWWTRVSRVPVSGGTPEHLWTFGEGNWGAWFSLSPDGRRIAYTAFTQESEVWVMENLAAVLRESGGGS